MINNLFLYAVSAGLNRAGVFLLLPFSARYINPEYFGELTLYLTSSSILSVLLTLNISVIISREYYNDRYGSLRYIYSHNFVMFSLASILLPIVFFYYESLFILFILFIVSECLFLVNSTYLRFKEGPRAYFRLTIVKFLSILFLFLFCSVQLDMKDDKLSHAIIMSILVSNFSFLLFCLNFKALSKSFKNAKQIVFKGFNFSYLTFALALIPHSISQWVSSSFDRFFVKWFFTDIELGLYSFSYSIASLLLLVSSGYALGLPQLCVANFKLLGSSLFYRFFFVFNSFAFIVFLCAAKMILPSFSEYNNTDIFTFITIIACGLYFLFFYLYFSSSLFYERKGKLISKITLFVCVYNLVALYPFAIHFGIVGVCLVTLTSYLLYMCIVAYYSVYANLKRVLLPVIFSFISVGLFLVG